MNDKKLKKEVRNKIVRDGLTIQREIQGIKINFEWNGGHGIEIWSSNTDKSEGTFVNIGDFKDDSVEISKVLKYVYDYELKWVNMRD